MNLPTTQVIERLISDFNLTQHMVSPARDKLILCPDPKWIEQFAKWIYQNRPFYQPETMDCDDIARWAQTAAGRARAAAAGIASGNAVFVATVEGVLGKSLNAIPFTEKYCTHDTLLIYDNTQTPWFCEPQTGLYCHAKDQCQELNPDGSIVGISFVDM